MRIIPSPKNSIKWGPGVVIISICTYVPISDMDFVRSYIGKNEPLTIWTLFSSLFDWFAVGPVKKWRKKCSAGQRFICTKVISYKIHTLVYLIFSFFFIFQIDLEKVCMLKWNNMHNSALYSNWPTSCFAFFGLRKLAIAGHLHLGFWD